MNPLSKVWLVTGSGSGLGRNIAEAVLASGDRVVATARDPRRLDDLVKKYGDQIRTAPLDVADEKAAYDLRDYLRKRGLLKPCVALRIKLFSQREIDRFLRDTQSP